MGNDVHPIAPLAQTLKPCDLYLGSNEIAATRNDAHVLVTEGWATSHGFQDLYGEDSVYRACINQDPNDLHSCWTTHRGLREQEMSHTL